MINIIFDRSAAGFVLRSFKKSIPAKCIFCGSKITAKNFGGVSKKKFICNSALCILDLARENSKE